MKKVTDWSFNCTEILNLHHLGTKFLGYEISCAHQLCTGQYCTFLVLPELPEYMILVHLS